uniref:Uncharacterized protein AlNc14C248G9595 n=1 Tax=Albugo laibachii Nc14 TaxID=890382 RepID=F0WTB0_9STRA|nr:conserved hypothetical protein [Albugo laibachii Nc14]|eukprot:CCA24599.1 conserved hypothetical protein [Albugo laibachii Nc14]
MGQTGSSDQRNAISAILSTKISQPCDDEADTKANTILAMRNFCQIFPSEDASDTHLDIKDRRLHDKVYALLSREVEESFQCANQELMEALLAVYHRLLFWRELYRFSCRSSFQPLLKCLAWPSEYICKSALDILMTMLAPPDAVDIVNKYQTVARRLFGESGGFETLTSLMVQFVNTEIDDTDAAHLKILAKVLMLFYVILVPRRDSTDWMTTMRAVGALLNSRVVILNFFHYPNQLIQQRAIDLVHELFFLLDLAQVQELQEAAREYGALLYALHGALTPPKNIQGKDEKERLSNELTSNKPNGPDHTGKLMELVEMFCAGNTRSKSAMCRIIPVELFIPIENRYDLVSRQTASSLSNGARIDCKISDTINKLPYGANSFTRWLHHARLEGENWKEILQAICEEHERPELVWHQEMRMELFEALEREIKVLEAHRRRILLTNAASMIRWEHELFYVEYNSMQNELLVNGYFIQYLIPEIADMMSPYEVVKPLVLAWHLVDRLSVEKNDRWRMDCVRCLRLLIRRHAMIFHGQLPMRLVLNLLGDHENQSLRFLQECLLLLNIAFMTTRNVPSEELNRSTTSITLAVINVLSSSSIARRLHDNHRALTNATAQHEHQFSKRQKMLQSDLEDDDDVLVRNDCDGLVRAGITVLLSIVRRAKYTLVLIHPKRDYLSRLLALETLDHVTVTRILTIFRQLSLVGTSTDQLMENASSITNGSNLKWKSTTFVYLLIASCDPKGDGMCLMSAEFLKENYVDLGRIITNTLSDEKCTGSQETSFKNLLHAAVGYNGCGMAQLLACRSSKDFVNVFNAEETRTADVMWDTKLRLRLFEYLKGKYSPFVQETKLPVPVPKQEQSTAAKQCDEGCRHLYIGEVFVRAYLEENGEMLTEWTTERYRDLIAALFDRLAELSSQKFVLDPCRDSISSESYLQSWEEQVMIEKTILKLLKTSCRDISILERDCELLSLPFHRSLLAYSDQLRGLTSLEIFQLLMNSFGDGPQEKYNRINQQICRDYMGKEGLLILGQALDRMTSPGYQHLLKLSARKALEAQESNTIRMLMCHTFDLLLTTMILPTSYCIVEENTHVIEVVLKFATRSFIQSNLSSSLLYICRKLTDICHYSRLRSQIVEAGGLLILTDACAFCQLVTDNTTESVNEDPITRTFESDMNSSIIIDVLEALALALKRISEEDDFRTKSSINMVLNQLLTPGMVKVFRCFNFLRILRKDHQIFLHKLRDVDRIVTPALVWTQSMRERLRDCLEGEVAKVRTASVARAWPLWNPDHFIAVDSFRYHYPEVADELIVHDVYVNIFLKWSQVELNDIDAASFSEALLISIQSTENVLRVLSERGSRDMKREDALTSMRLAYKKLVSAYPEHNLEVTTRGSNVVLDCFRASNLGEFLPKVTTPDTEQNDQLFSSENDDLMV